MPKKKKTLTSPAKINLANFNYYGLDHDKVKEKFEGELTYVGSFCIKEEYTPRAFYFNAKPNREKLHKDYMTIQSNGAGRWAVSGIDKEQLEQWRFQDGLKCLDCNDVIYSTMRHDYRHCKCKKIFIDGGRDYVRASLGNSVAVRIDLINGTYEEDKH